MNWLRILPAALAAAGVCGLSQAALAADVQLPVKAPRAAPVYDWTGFYVGVNAGYGIASDGTSTAVNTALLPYPNYSPRAAGGVDGWLAGGQLGFNWQSGHAVFGIEADLQAARQNGSMCLNTCPFGSGGAVSVLDQELMWFGTLRGRLGIAERGFLIFATGGLAVGELEMSLTATTGAPPGGTTTVRSTRSGWTIGGGAEAALTESWSAKIEYLYIDLGTQSGTTPAFLAGNGATFVAVFDTKFHDHIVRAGLNYRLGAEPKAMPEALPAWSSASADRWQGLYLGANAGYAAAKGSSSQATHFAFGPRDYFATTPNGWLGGGQIGYNWQAGKLVFGAEADFQLSNQRNDSICVSSCNPFGYLTLDQKLPWFGTVRGRLGYAAGPALFYATGGLAFGRVEMTTAVLSGGIATGPLTHNTNKAGWTLGGGIEGAVSDRWTAKAEYLYIDLGSTSFDLNDGGPGIFGQRTITSDIQNHVFRLGVNYRIN